MNIASPYVNSQRALDYLTEVFREVKDDPSFAAATALAVNATSSLVMRLDVVLKQQRSFMKPAKPRTVRSFEAEPA